MADASLIAKLESPGFTPAARDIVPVFSVLALADDDLAKHAERALSRLGDRAARRAIDSFVESTPPFRARLCSLVGRVFGDGEVPDLGPWLAERLGDSDSKTRRRAASALGKSRDPSYEAPLLAAFRKATELPERRALAAALGSVGRDAALGALSSLESSDAELARIVKEARVKVERTLLRNERSAIRDDVSPREPAYLLLHVRAGLEDLLLDELGSGWDARSTGRGRVMLTLTRPLREVFRARTFLDVGFPLRPENARERDVAAAVVRALTSDAAFQVLSTFTSGPIRYRLDWASAGRRRATTFDVAARVRSARPNLVNDPTGALWEAVVSTSERGGDTVVHVELWPRGLVDVRFSYRKVALPASSHPTVAAALARIAGIAENDVVWDPFVGAGTELVERALLGSYAALYGSDTDGRALDAARENLGAASVARFTLAEGDARSWGPPVEATLVITNPPYGRRVLGRDAIGPLLRAALGNAAKRMADGGRLVWVSPMPRATFEMARDMGFHPGSRLPVDLGGVRGEIQEFRIGKRTAKRGGERRGRRKL